VSPEALIAVSAAFLVSLLLTAVIRKVALVRGVLDFPGSRSSHTLPTPRGGGFAIVLTVLVVVTILDARGAMPHSLASALLLGGAAVALVGLADDVRSVSVTVRLAVQFAAISWCVWSLGSLPAVNFGIAVWNLGAAGSVAAVIFLVWFLNLYNFMDGIDGIAGVEAISVLAFAMLLMLWQGGSPSIALLLMVVVASVTGFLCWNWPPAKIFMGDSGSGFLGFCLGAIAWATIVERRLSMWVWLILLGAFIVDATLTLLRRWRRGARLAQAHRSHAYQRLSRRYGSHLKVTLGILAVNVLWLDPLAFAAAARPAFGSLLAVIAWAPLAFVAWRCGAGLEEDDP
jgi:Fuc2NAc and GlcNAc transferase